MAICCQCEDNIYNLFIDGLDIHVFTVGIQLEIHVLFYFPRIRGYIFKNNKSVNPSVF
jgi:hypothetical protein